VAYALASGSSSSDGDWTISGSDMYSAVSGNVGIGTTSPDSKLKVVASGGTAVYGIDSGSGTYGVLGDDVLGGAFGYHGSSGNWGKLGTELYGVFGRSDGFAAVSGGGVRSRDIWYLWASV
jgi:hypothetical protein